MIISLQKVQCLLQEVVFAHTLCESAQVYVREICRILEEEYCAPGIYDPATGNGWFGDCIPRIRQLDNDHISDQNFMNAAVNFLDRLTFTYQ